MQRENLIKNTFNLMQFHYLLQILDIETYLNPSLSKYSKVYTFNSSNQTFTNNNTFKTNLSLKFMTLKLQWNRNKLALCEQNDINISNFITNMKFSKFITNYIQNFLFFNYGIDNLEICDSRHFIHIFKRRSERYSMKNFKVNIRNVYRNSHVLLDISNEDFKKKLKKTLIRRNIKKITSEDIDRSSNEDKLIFVGDLKELINMNYGVDDNSEGNDSIVNGGFSRLNKDFKKLVKSSVKSLLKLTEERKINVVEILLINKELKDKLKEKGFYYLFPNNSTSTTSKNPSVNITSLTFLSLLFQKDESTNFIKLFINYEQTEQTKQEGLSTNNIVNIFQQYFKVKVAEEDLVYTNNYEIIKKYPKLGFYNEYDKIAVNLEEKGVYLVLTDFMDNLQNKCLEFELFSNFIANRMIK